MTTTTNNWKLAAIKPKGWYDIATGLKGITPQMQRDVDDCEEIYIYTNDIQYHYVAVFPVVNDNISCFFIQGMKEGLPMPKITDEDKDLINQMVWEGDFPPYKTLISKLHSELSRLGINTNIAGRHPIVNFQKINSENVQNLSFEQKEIIVKTGLNQKMIISYGLHELASQELISLDDAIETLAGLYLLPDQAGYAAVLDTIIFSKWD